MNRLSIKFRVTLWYALLMIFMIMMVLGVLLSIGGALLENEAKDRLIKLVNSNVGEVEYDDGELEIDDDAVFYKNGVFVQVYGTGAAPVVGQLPPGVAISDDFQDGQLRTVTLGDGRYYLYDRHVTPGDGSGLWMRGMIKADEGAGMMGVSLNVLFFALPVFGVLALVGGYLITKRAFRPIEAVRKAGAEIDSGRDLSKRIPLGKNRDEARLLAETFNHMFERLEISFESEKRFVSDASHELRTPTSVILAQCDYALEHAATAEECHESLTVVRRQARKMSGLITQLLAFARLEQGIEPVHMAPANISELVSAVCDEMAGAGDKNIRLQASIAPGIHAMANQDLLIRLVSNLIQNAFRYGRQNGHIWVGLRRDGAQIVLTVRDDGLGIAAQDQPKIWKRFYRCDQARPSGQNEGAGLGLSMAKEIATLHGGHMGVFSAPGQGSEFVFAFPARLV